MHRSIARKLLQIKAIKLSPQKPFTWASGLRSPVYCDNRIALSYPEFRSFLTDCFDEKSRQFDPFDTVAAVATAGIAHGALLAQKLELPFVYVRSEAKSHGRKNRIEGRLKGDERVLVIEDLISTGGSSLRAVEALRETGCTVIGVLAIFSYGFPETDGRFHAAGCEFKTLTDYDTLLAEAVSSDYITEEQARTLNHWRQDAQNWSRKRE
ncbi:MAG: orotate phosphoribosyltransferase [Saprospiraceae bacterium]|nr:orotate phosphoribosyltransferase [Saprospiraceae bacterium]